VAFGIETNELRLHVLYQIKNRAIRASKTARRDLGQIAILFQPFSHCLLGELNPKLVRSLPAPNRVLERGICRDQVKLHVLSRIPAASKLTYVFTDVASSLDFLGRR